MFDRHPPTSAQPWAPTPGPSFIGGVLISSSAVAVPVPGHAPFGPDLGVDFTAWPRTCLITTNLPDDLASWLGMAVIHGPFLLALPGSCGAGHQLARPLPCEVPALRSPCRASVPSHSAPGSPSLGDVAWSSAHHTLLS